MIYKSATERAREMKGEPAQSPFKLATVTSASGQIRFWGEDTPSSKTYKRLKSYTPTVGDTVVLARVNSSYVILGAII